MAAIAAAPGSATAGTPGSESGAFAPIDVGARALGMGGAGAALDRGAWATYWNPANLFHLEQTTVAVDYADLFGLGLARHTALAFAWRHEPTRNVIRDGRVVTVPRAEDQLGLGFSLAVTTVDLEPETYTEVTPGFSLAGRPWAGIALGGTFKFLRVNSDLEEVSAIGYALDLGLTLDQLPAVTVVAAVKNLLSTVSWSNNTTDELPIELTLGAAHTLGVAPVTVAVEATGATDNFPLRVARLGGEWAHRGGLLSLRAGAIVHEDRDQDQLELTFGAGTAIAGVRADYAFVGHNNTLDDTHRVSLALRF